MDEISVQLPGFAPAARLIKAPGNVGFAAGANLGVAAARGELIVLLNPDAVVCEGFLDAIRAPWGGSLDAWMALVTMDSGTSINTSGGVLHFTGLAWAGQLGLPLSEAPSRPAAVGFLSGACLAIPAATWKRLGGFPERYFMYCEDVDLSLRIRLGGGQLALIPDARVVHAYEFHKGAVKWRLLERNRWATIIRCYPAPLLALVAPALLGAELAVWAVALRDGWAVAKARASAELLVALPRLLRERREIQRRRVIGAYEFSAALTAQLSSPHLQPARLPLLGAGLDAYWRAVRALLRLCGPGRGRGAPADHRRAGVR